MKKLIGFVALLAFTVGFVGCELDVDERAVVIETAASAVVSNME